MPRRDEIIQSALEHLQGSDPVMRRLIRQVGPFTLRTSRRRFHLLMRSIISQQISTQAARTIRQRLDDLIAPDDPTPESVAALSIDQLRSVGLSAQKASYMHDLAAKVQNGTVRLQRIGRQDDEAVIRELCQVKGIGRWTAQMFLIFALGRWDVFPDDDLGIRAAIQRLYRFESLPDKKQLQEISQPWRPFATVATWYCWRSGDLARDPTTPGAEYPV